MLRRVSRGFEIDYEKLEKTVVLSVRFLDNVIEMNRYPVPQIEAMAKGNRKIGLGIMGFADMLIRMGIAYDSPEAVPVAEKLMGFIQQAAWRASEGLAKERGVFPNFDKSVWARRGQRMRNATTTTIAPTGTLSILAGCSSGIEPLYGVGYVRTVMDNDRLVELHPLFVAIAKREGILDPRRIARIASEGSVRSMRKLPSEIRRLFVTAHDIPPRVHVRMQAAFQRFTDNAVSKTVNFPERATPDDVKAVFRMAYEEGLKGVTVYRSGSRRQQVLACSAGRIDYC
jgi:ribonucleoside-diphosphate reductase alpha chain